MLVGFGELVWFDVSINDILFGLKTKAISGMVRLPAASAVAPTKLPMNIPSITLADEMASKPNTDGNTKRANSPESEPESILVSVSVTVISIFHWPAVVGRQFPMFATNNPVPAPIGIGYPDLSRCHFPHPSGSFRSCLLSPECR